MMTINEIGEKIAVARKLKNLSQAQLSEQLAVSAQAVGKWERGESMPDILMFQRLAAILGTDLNYFSGESALPPDRQPALFSSTAEETPAPEKPEWNMSHGNWVDADFSGLHGLAEKFSGANIERCRFVESELSGLTLRGNNIKGSDFTRSTLNNCRFSMANIERCVFAGCDLSKSEFLKSNVVDCDFSSANFTGVTGKMSSLQRINFTGAILHRMKFAFGSLSDITFTGELTECAFENCDFAKVKFDGAVLRECFFKNSKLKRAAFTNCKADRLTYAFLKSCKADLSDVTVLEDEKA